MRIFINRSGEEVLPLVFVRDYFAIDDWLSEAIQNYLQKSPIFKDSTLRALQDYEVNISYSLSKMESSAHIYLLS